MRKVLEVQARTVEEAIQQGLRRLGVSEEDVQIDILDAGSESALCLRPAQVRVTQDGGNRLINETRSVVLDILRLMGIDAKVEAFLEDGKIYATIDSDAGGLLIGKSGRNIDALQHVVNRIINRGNRERAIVVLDTEDYRRRRRESLEDLAFRVAERVRDSGRRIVLQEMNPHDRRIVHLALADDPEVETVSEGDGFFKRIFVQLVPQRR